MSRLVVDADGNLYGTTQLGGGQRTCDFGYGCGTVFKVDKTGKEVVLHSFTGTPDGGNPYAGMVRNKDGNLYGTTYAGGTAYDGTVFRMDRAGKESVIYSFRGRGDGAQPSSEMIVDNTGNLYGVSQEGGTGTGCYGGCGTVFKVDVGGKETVLYSLNQNTGDYPVASLIRDNAGNFYSTGLEGGAGITCVNGCGTIFELGENGVETTLFNFMGSAGGGNPEGTLIRDGKGNLYGTTFLSGDSSCFMGYGCGVLFRLSPSGEETVIHTFSGSPDGAFPFGSLLVVNGVLYGTTEDGGDAACECGTVFSVSASGALQILHSFSGTDGAGPAAGLVADSAGNLYGTTEAGGDLTCDPGTGAQGCGVVFKITP